MYENERFGMIFCLFICFFFTLSGFSFTSPTFLTVVGRERRLMLSTSTFGLCGLVPYTSKFRFVRSISRTSLPPRLPMVPVRQQDYRYDDNHPLGTRKIHRSDGSFEQTPNTSAIPVREHRQYHQDELSESLESAPCIFFF